MERYQPKPVEAVRWMKEDDYPMTRIIRPEMLYSRSGSHYYLSHKDVPSDAWLPTNPGTEGNEGQMLPFAFWSVKTGLRITLEWDTIGETLTSEQNLHFRRALQWAREKNPQLVGRILLPYGVLEIRKEDGSHDKNFIVNQGDWIVKDAMGRVSVMPAGQFIQMHEPMA